MPLMATYELPSSCSSYDSSDDEVDVALSRRQGQRRRVDTLNTEESKWRSNDGNDDKKQASDDDGGDGKETTDQAHETSSSQTSSGSRSRNSSLSKTGVASSSSTSSSSSSSFSPPKDEAGEVGKGEDAEDVVDTDEEEEKMEHEKYVAAPPRGKALRALRVSLTRTGTATATAREAEISEAKCGGLEQTDENDDEDNNSSEEKDSDVCRTEMEAAPRNDTSGIKSIGKMGAMMRRRAMVVAAETKRKTAEEGTTKQHDEEDNQDELFEQERNDGFENEDYSGTNGRPIQPSVYGSKMRYLGKMQAIMRRRAYANITQDGYRSLVTKVAEKADGVDEASSQEVSQFDEDSINDEHVGNIVGPDRQVASGSEHVRSTGYCSKMRAMMKRRAFLEGKDSHKHRIQKDECTEREEKEEGKVCNIEGEDKGCRDEKLQESGKAVETSLDRSNVPSLEKAPATDRMYLDEEKDGGDVKSKGCEVTATESAGDLASTLGTLDILHEETASESMKIDGVREARGEGKGKGVVLIQQKAAESQVGHKGTKEKLTEDDDENCDAELCKQVDADVDGGDTCSDLSSSSSFGVENPFDTSRRRFAPASITAGPFYDEAERSDVSESVDIAMATIPSGAKERGDGENDTGTVCVTHFQDGCDGVVSAPLPKLETTKEQLPNTGSGKSRESKGGNSSDELDEQIAHGDLIDGQSAVSLRKTGSCSDDNAGGGTTGDDCENDDYYCDLEYDDDETEDPFRPNRRVHRVDCAPAEGAVKGEPKVCAEAGSQAGDETTVEEKIHQGEGGGSDFVGIPGIREGVQGEDGRTEEEKLEVEEGEKEEEVAEGKEEEEGEQEEDEDEDFFLENIEDPFASSRNASNGGAGKKPGEDVDRAPDRKNGECPGKRALAGALSGKDGAVKGNEKDLQRLGENTAQEKVKGYDQDELTTRDPFTTVTTPPFVRVVRNKEQQCIRGLENEGRVGGCGSVSMNVDEAENPESVRRSVGDARGVLGDGSAMCLEEVDAAVEAAAGTTEKAPETSYNGAAKNSIDPEGVIGDRAMKEEGERNGGNVSGVYGRDQYNAKRREQGRQLRRTVLDELFPASTSSSEDDDGHSDAEGKQKKMRPSHEENAVPNKSAAVTTDTTGKGDDSKKDSAATSDGIEQLSSLPEGSTLALTQVAPPTLSSASSGSSVSDGSCAYNSGDAVPADDTLSEQDTVVSKRSVRSNSQATKKEKKKKKTKKTKKKEEKKEKKKGKKEKKKDHRRSTCGNRDAYLLRGCPEGRDLQNVEEMDEGSEHQEGSNQSRASPPKKPRLNRHNRFQKVLNDPRPLLSVESIFRRRSSTRDEDAPKMPKNEQLEKTIAPPDQKQHQQRTAREKQDDVRLDATDGSRRVSRTSERVTSASVRRQERTMKSPVTVVPPLFPPHHMFEYGAGKLPSMDRHRHPLQCHPPLLLEYDTPLSPLPASRKRNRADRRVGRGIFIRKDLAGHLTPERRITVYNRETCRIVKEAILVKDLTNVLASNGALEPLVPPPCADAALRQPSPNEDFHVRCEDDCSRVFLREGRTGPRLRVCSSVRRQADTVRSPKQCEGCEVLITAGPHSGKTGVVTSCIPGGWFKLSDVSFVEEDSEDSDHENEPSVDVTVKSNDVEFLKEEEYDEDGGEADRGEDDDGSVASPPPSPPRLLYRSWKLRLDALLQEEKLIQNAIGGVDGERDASGENEVFCDAVNFASNDSQMSTGMGTDDLSSDLVFARWRSRCAYPDVVNVLSDIVRQVEYRDLQETVHRTGKYHENKDPNNLQGSSSGKKLELATAGLNDSRNEVIPSIPSSARHTLDDVPYVDDGAAPLQQQLRARLNRIRLLICRLRHLIKKHRPTSSPSCRTTNQRRDERGLDTSPWLSV